MKKVLCFGDSNTYGFNPINGTRYAKSERWSGILQGLTKGDFQIVEAGCNNRTAFSENPAGKMMTGIKILPECLTDNFDIVIIAVGINDLQFSYDVKISDYEIGIERLINIVKEKLPSAKIILLSPSEISENILNSFFANLFDEKSIEKSKLLSSIYEKIANKYNCEILDLNKIATPSKTDGFHYEIEEHNKIANCIFELLKKF